MWEDLNEQSDRLRISQQEEADQDLPGGWLAWKKSRPISIVEGNLPMLSVAFSVSDSGVWSAGLRHYNGNEFTGPWLCRLQGRDTYSNLELAPTEDSAELVPWRETSTLLKPPAKFVKRITVIKSRISFYIHVYKCFFHWPLMHLNAAFNLVNWHLSNNSSRHIMLSNTPTHPHTHKLTNECH